MELVKRTPKKLIAIVLSVVLLISTIPAGMFNVFADQFAEFTVKLDNYNKSGSVTLTESDDSTAKMTSTVEDGEAVFANFVDSAKSYDIQVSNLVGYDAYTANSVTFTENSYTVSALTETAKITVSGTIVDENNDPASNVTVAYSAYDGEITGDVKTNSEGNYSFQAYANNKYDLTITGADKYYTRTTSVNSATNTDLGTYQLQVKEFIISTNYDNTKGSVVVTNSNVLYGEDTSATITAGQNYIISKVTIGDEEKTDAAGKDSYTINFNNVKESYNINVEFVLDEIEVTFNITKKGKVEISDGSSISTAGVVTVSNDNDTTPLENKVKLLDGQTIQAKVTDNNYHLESFIVNDAETIATFDNDTHQSDVYTFVKGHKTTITVKFALDTYTIKASDGIEDGYVTIGDETEKTVEYGSNNTVIISPKDNSYKLASLTVKTDSNPTGTAIDVNADANLERNSDGSYSYLINNVSENYEIFATFSAIDTLSGIWTQYVSLTPTTGSLIDTYYDNSGNEVRVYTNDTILVMQALAPYGYTDYHIKGKQKYSIRQGKYIDDYEDVLSNSKNRKVSSCIIDSLQVQVGSHGEGFAEVPLDGKYLIIIIDQTKPQVADVPAMNWNNTGSYTVNGTVTDEDTESKPSSGLSYVVWSTTSKSDSDVKAETENKTSINADGEYSFTVSGEQNQTYYIYAVDVAGNVSTAKTFTAKIDTTKPTVDNFAFSGFETSDNTGIYASSNITATVTASDTGSTVTNSGVDKIQLLVDGVAYGEPKSVNSNNQATFTLAANDFTTAKTISAYAIDKAGNNSDTKKPTDVTTTYTSDKVIINTTEATVNVTKQDSGKYTATDSKDWYASDALFTIAIDSNNAGVAIKNISLKLNNTNITVDSQGNDLNTNLGTTKTFTINTSQDGTTNKTGANTLTGTVRLKNGKTTNISGVLYIDTVKPAVTNFELTSKGTTALAKVLNFLTFGNFFNEKIEIKVTASDSGDSAGLKEMTLYGDEVALDTQPIVNGVATFVVPAEDIADETLHLNKTISAKAKDNVGNITAEFVYPTTTNSATFQHSGLMIETKKPTIAVAVPDPATGKNALTATDGDWYADDIDYNVTISDPDSGIRCVEIEINDTPITTDKDGKNIAEAFNAGDTKVTDLTFRLNTDQVTINDDGSYTIEITVTDNAGNVTETYTKTTYKDVDDPSIVDFKFEATGYHNDDAVTSANQAPVVEKTYGYYFIEDTMVTITAADAVPTAGVKSITYYTVDKDGGKSDETTVNVTADNKITFTIPADFKGQVYAKATDNVDNTPDEYVNPNSAIVESPELHERTSSITYAPAAKDVDGKDATRDADGNLLYANDANVGIEIVDSYSGIRQVDWEIVSPFDDKKQAGKLTIDNDGDITTTTEEGFSDDCLANWDFEMEDNLVVKLTNTFTITNNSNNIEIRITLTDRAGNVTENVVQKLSVDKTAPKIAIHMNENDDNTYTGFFKDDRSVEVYVYERNFNQDDFNFVVKRTDDNEAKFTEDITPKFTKLSDAVVIDGVECYVYKMNFKLTKDGDYDFKVNAKDLTDHKIADKDVKYSSNKSADYTVQNDKDRTIDNNFTIDHVAPKVTVSYKNNNGKGKYFNKPRIATIRIEEHNFTDAKNRIKYTRTSKLDGKTIKTPVVKGWTRSGNVYTAHITYNNDGDYTFGIEVTDKAGNVIKDKDVKYPNGRKISKDFTIDQTIKKPQIGGVEKGKSYKENVIPTIRVDDVNFDSSTVKLFRTRANEKNVDVTREFIKNKPVNRKTVSEDTFTKIKENDGIYTLEVSLTDKAGNSAKDSVTFTVNRFGSVYVYSDDLSAIKGSYVQEVDGDITITEYNPDRLVKDSLKVEITRDGEPLSDVDVKVTPVINNTVKLGDSGWYQYEYKFDNSNFDKEGIYTISVASEDTVGNKPESTNDSEILFRVDKTPPEIVSVKGLEKGSVNAVEHTVEYSIYDAIGLKEIVVYINNIAQDPITDFEDLTNYTGSFVIGTGYRNSVRIEVTDLSGRTIDTSSDSFKPEFKFNEFITVSTNPFVRWYSNKPLFWGSIAGIAVAAGLIIFFVAKKRKTDNGGDEGEAQPAE